VPTFGTPTYLLIVFNSSNSTLILKKIIFLLLIALITACSDKPVSRIEGEVPGTQYDNEWVYLVPIEGATAQTVDSTQIQKGRFQFQISANKQNRIYILRLQPLLRLRLQDILVITEPGSIQVRMDSVSYASGTPLNQTLQEWKDQQRENIPQYTAYVHQLVLENKNNAVGKFIYSLHKSLFTEAEIQEIESDK
jgi:hypothetical protein